MTRDRWQKDEYRYPPYIYQQQHLVKDSQGKLRIPTIQEKERLMGFVADYTSLCVSKSLRKGREWLDLRHSLIGNTWSIPCVMILLQQLCHKANLVAKRTSQEVIDLCWRYLRPSSVDPHQPTSELSLKFVETLLLNSSYKGQDVKISPDCLDSPNVWPRKPIDSSWWTWRICRSWPYAHKLGKEHINALELRALLHAVQWRTRSPSNVRTKYFHLLDSQVCLGVVGKGRSASRKLAPILRRLSALLLVTGSSLFCGYVKTDQNPADRP
jgi:hypothetical protein